MNLLIVESPAKAKKIQGFLGSGWIVRASVGHVRDLPGSGQTIPEKYRALPWINLGVDVEGNYRTVYLVYEDKKKIIRDLKHACKDADEVLLATDPDREGESIAWHLAQELGLKAPKRVTYQEITETAIKKAIANPRSIDMNLVAAQESRRILDRLVGYGSSPLVSKALGTSDKRRSHSAGRVQSAALMMLAGREHARMGFASASVNGVKVRIGTAPEFQATLIRLGTQTIATPASFGPDGALKADAQEHLLLSSAQAKEAAGILTNSSLTVVQVSKKPLVRRAPAPLTTSALQQAASKLKFSAKKTADTAQRLYEQGLITYIRTDSPALSDEAVRLGQNVLRELFGAQVLPEQVRRHAAKGNAQEAHEAIRPTEFTAPEQTGLEGDELALYRLIYETTLASLMKDAAGERTSVLLDSGKGHLLAAAGTVITDPGYLQLLKDEEDGEEDASLPALQKQQSIPCVGAEVTSAQSKPPARFTEGKLIAALEKVGIGRPSTYPSILGTLQNRGYVVNEKGALHVTPLGLVATGYLSVQLPSIVDRHFTARMEEDLDRIAGGELRATTYLDTVWKNGLALSIAQAGVAAPQVAVPGFPGAVLSSKNSEVTLSYQGRTAILHEKVLSEELTEKNLERLMNGQAVRGQRASRPKTTGSKAGTRKKTSLA